MQPHTCKLASVGAKDKLTFHRKMQTKICDCYWAIEDAPNILEFGKIDALTKYHFRFQQCDIISHKLYLDYLIHFGPDNINDRNSHLNRAISIIYYYIQLTIDASNLQLATFGTTSVEIRFKLSRNSPEYKLSMGKGISVTNSSWTT